MYLPFHSPLFVGCAIMAAVGASGLASSILPVMALD
jgi:hypothetical protein